MRDEPRVRSWWIERGRGLLRKATHQRGVVQHCRDKTTAQASYVVINYNACMLIFFKKLDAFA